MAKAPRHQFSGDAGWLYSDNQIINRSVRTTHPQGVQFSLDLPNGETMAVVLDKTNASTMTQYCEMARETYHEWQAEQEAKEERQARDREIIVPEGNQPRERDATVEDAISAFQKGPQGIAALEERIASDLVAARQERNRLSERVDELNAEISKLEQLEAVFNASKILGQTGSSVSAEVDGNQPSGSEGVGGEASDTSSTDGGSGAIQPEGEGE